MLGVGVPVGECGAVLAGVKAGPCGWPAASLDSGCGRRGWRLPGADIVSNLSFGSGVVVIGSHTGSPDPRQHPFGSGHSPYPASYAGTTGGEGRSCCPGFPAAFRPPALACRVIRFPLRSWAFLTVGLPATNLAPDPNGVPTFCTYQIRPGRVPPRPRGRRCSPDRTTCPTGACRFPTASPYTPLAHPIGEAPHYGASTGVHAIHPSGLPLACNPRMGREPSGFPLSFAPHRHQRRTSGRAGREHAPRTTQPTSTSALQSASSLASCNLVSQGHVRTCSTGYPMA